MSSFRIYSQAINFENFVHGGIDPCTEQCTCEIPIYEAPMEARNFPMLDLFFSFSPLNSKNVGFGQNWSRNLSSYQHRRQFRILFLFTGEQYRITKTTNLLTILDQKLKSFQFKWSNNDYELIHKSGQIEILFNLSNFYNTTVPTEIYSSNGRSLKLVWIRVGEQPRLSKIQGDQQDLLEIEYTFFMIRITRAPGTAKVSIFTLVLRNNQLVRLNLPGPNATTWIFTYQNVSSITCLRQVISSIGLIEQLNYRERGHRLPHGAPFDSVPYVISHTVLPGSQQPRMTTFYTYSDFNFLGFGGGRNWNDGEDNLFFVPHDYQYTATVSEKGGAIVRYI